MARLQAGMRTTELLVKQGSDPAKAAARVADFHRGVIAEVKAQNSQVLGGGGLKAEITTVDGKRTAPLESVKLDGGRIDTLFPFPIWEILKYIHSLLLTRSPVGPAGGAGTYRYAHRLFADGVETDPDSPELAAESWVFSSTLPYSRRIERGQGSAPKDGVYQGAAALAMQKFGKIASIRFSYEAVVKNVIKAPPPRSKRRKRSLLKDERYPAIRIRLR